MEITTYRQYIIADDKNISQEEIDYVKNIPLKKLKDNDIVFTNYNSYENFNDDKCLAIINKYQEVFEEIRYRTMGHISTQNRCVTKEDYEARTLNMPAKFGNIAKIYASRGGAVRNAERQRLTDMVYDIIEKMGHKKSEASYMDLHMDAIKNPDKAGSMKG